MSKKQMQKIRRQAILDVLMMEFLASFFAGIFLYGILH